MNNTIKSLVISALVAEGVSSEILSGSSFVVEHPAELVKGDYSTNAALVFSKILKRNPVDLAKAIVERIAATLPVEIEKVEMAGPGFINFYLSPRFFAETLKDILGKGDAYGSNTSLSGETWAVEYGSPNPNKAMHLGHVRNVITGISLCNLLEANGAKVIREMVDNNRGIAIAKLMWGYLVSAKKDGARIEDLSYWHSHKEEWLTPKDVAKKPDRYMDELYVLGSSECENPDTEKKVRSLVVEWEANDPIVRDLWQTVLDFSYKGQRQTLGRLGAHFDYIWHEHEHYEEGKKYVEEGVKKGIFKKLEDCAILTDLESFGLSDTIVQKNDGTSLYITQDIALTDLKKKKHNADRMVWVIGPEQSLALSQMFAVCEQFGIGKREEFTHIAYGYVTIKGQGKMSSRSGNVVFADDLLDEIKAKVEEIMKDRLEGDDKDTIAENISHGAVVYEMLKAGRTRDVAFDVAAALSLEGDSGPYLQYAHTRAVSVLRKAEEAGIVADTEQIELLPENDLIKKLYRFPEIVEESQKIQAPQQLVTYLTELASSFNNFYAHNKIAVEGDESSAVRVALASAFTVVMKNGLSLLGIGIPSKM